MRHLVAAMVALAGLGLSGCGAGLIGGIASSDSGSNGEVLTPQLNFADQELPMAPRAGDVRTVVVAGAQLTGSTIEVKIATSVGVAVQRNAIAQVQGASTIVSFELYMDELFPLASEPAAVDRPATLSVFADGKLIGESIPITLVRRPIATLVFADPAETDAELSPFGERVKIAVDGLRTGDASLLQVLVTTPDPGAGVLGATITRLATEVVFAPVSSTEPSIVPVILATIPANAFPDRVTIQVLDPIAGQSTEIENAYYRPEFALALPGQGSTTGGTLLTLIGSALVPYDLGSFPARYDFDRITLMLAKGGRVTELPGDEIRVAESALDRLVFTMPPSPDGRPGVVDIILTVALEDHDVTVTAKLFLFANPDPFFGPRGAVLAQTPVKSVPIQLDNAPLTTDAPDFALLTEQGGVGFVQLLLAQQNGMFQPFAAPIQVGNHEIAAERNPRDLLVGDFDGDQVPDMFVVNEGVPGGVVHHVVLGQERPAPPIGAVVPVHAMVGAAAGRVAFFDGDDLPDIILIPQPEILSAELTYQPPIQVLLSRPTAFGEPAFLAMPELDFGLFNYEAIEVADFDGDGVMDIAVVSGSELRISMMLGNGDGTFVPEYEIDAGSIPLYGAASDDSPAVGLHSCENGERPSLALVLAGSASKVPAVAVFNQEFESISGQWSLQLPGQAGVFVAPQFGEPVGQSLVANLDEEGPIEMVLAVAGEPQIVSGGLLQFDLVERGFRALEIENAGGTEVPVNVSELVFATAFPGDSPLSERKAVFVVHEVDVDNTRERRLSTRLVQVGKPLRLLTPDAGGGIPLVIDGIVAGLFTGDDVAPDRSALDLALVTKGAENSGEVRIIDNDGFGGFPQLDAQLSVSSLLPRSVALVPGVVGQSDLLVCLSSNGVVTIWDPSLGDGVPNVNVQARQLSVPGLLDDESQIQVEDVDRDGFLDVILLLSLSSLDPGQDHSLLVLMRGKPVTFGEFPFEVPTNMLEVHGNASAFTLANFTEATEALEMAVAIPTGTSSTSLDGNHIIFCRYSAGQTPKDDKFELSSEIGGPVNLLAGSQPARLASSDFDGDGVSDLIVACEGDDTLRLFRNTDAPGGQSSEVNVGAFEEALGSPWQLGAGKPTILKLSDVNGDGNLDVVVVTEFTGQTTATSVASYLSTGTGDFGDARFVSATRAGLFPNKLSLDLGDWNSDGVPDLFLGWALQLSATANLRVLFGGTK